MDTVLQVLLLVVFVGGALYAIAKIKGRAP